MLVEIGHDLVDRSAMRFDVKHLGLSRGLLEQVRQAFGGRLEGVLVPTRVAADELGAVKLGGRCRRGLERQYAALLDAEPVR